MSWQGNPDVDPSIWFVGASGTPEWVLVRWALYPVLEAKTPGNLEEIAENCSRLSKIGHFASVAFAHIDQFKIYNKEKILPLYRGDAAEIDFQGLRPIR